MRPDAIAVPPPAVDDDPGLIGQFQKRGYAGQFTSRRSGPQDPQKCRLGHVVHQREARRAAYWAGCTSTLGRPGHSAWFRLLS